MARSSSLLGDFRVQKKVNENGERRKGKRRQSVRGGTGGSRLPTAAESPDQSVLGPSDIEHLSHPRIMDKMQSSKHQVSDKAKKAMMSLLSLKNTNARSENYQIFKEDDQVSSGGPAYGPKPSKKGKRIKHTREDSDTDVTGNLIGRDDSRLVVAGIPDMGDPCFRRYANCIIVNAQPYERRSTTGLITCKAHCLQSQSGAYNCRSFIYDNINQVAQLPD
ncbi:hypothetical protein WR25_06731 [Diploscapter pachys]|uniref:Apple domain-containing protein n=1 Tax=Diploscapter pachys TaxID=2018661 RepID=A0A2A2KWT1_9BILA|nr:hypothetical protein WR25_06731 [Diploscapter pachys]